MPPKLAVDVSKPIPGFERGDLETPELASLSLVYSIQGEPKSGKSSFAFYGPGPQAVLDIDDRLKGVVDDWLLGRVEGHPAKRIDRLALHLPKVDLKSRKPDSLIQTQAEAEWKRFLDHFRMAGQSAKVKGGIRVLSIDDATTIVDLRLMAEFGRLSMIPQTARGQANVEMGNLMRESRRFGCSVIWVHELKDEYGTVKKVAPDGQTVVDREATGKRILDGYKKAHYCVDTMLQTRWNGKDRRFEIDVLQSGVRSQTNGRTYTEEDWDELGPFAYVSSLQYPRTNPYDWRDPLVEEE